MFDRTMHVSESSDIAATGAVSGEIVKSIEENKDFSAANLSAAQAEAIVERLQCIVDSAEKASGTKSIVLASAQPGGGTLSTPSAFVDPAARQVSELLKVGGIPRTMIELTPFLVSRKLLLSR